MSYVRHWCASVDLSVTSVTICSRQVHEVDLLVRNAVRIVGDKFHHIRHLKFSNVSSRYWPEAMAKVNMPFLTSLDLSRCVWRAPSWMSASQRCIVWQDRDPRCHTHHRSKLPTSSQAGHFEDTNWRCWSSASVYYDGDRVLGIERDKCG